MKFAVIGAGCGGKSMAAELKAQGAQVALSDRNAETIETIQQAGSIRLTGKIELEGTPDLLTTDNAAVAKDANVVMVVTTTDAHDAVAASIAPVLRDGQVIVLNPGMFLGSVAFHAALKRAGCTADVTVAETADLMYTCRMAPDGTVFHSGLKKSMRFAAEHAADTEKVGKLLQPWFPVLTPVENILYTGLSSMGAALHCVPMLMNANRIDCGERFEYYTQGITQSVARLCEAVDHERVALAAALGIQVAGAVQGLRAAYGLDGKTLYDCVTGCKAYAGIMAPSTLEHRFCREDTYGSLTAYASVADTIGVPTPAIHAVITCISLITGVDYMTVGRTAERMGVAGMTAAQICELVR